MEEKRNKSSDTRSKAFGTNKINWLNMSNWVYYINALSGFKYNLFGYIKLLNAQQHNNVITNTNIKVANCHKQYIIMTFYLSSLMNSCYATMNTKFPFHNT